MYEDITYESIMDRMLEKIPDTVDKREGSIIYDALAPAAVEIMNMYIELDGFLKLTFADTSVGEYLDRRAGEKGIYREPATKAVLKGEFTPETLELPDGARFSCDTLNYVMVEKLSPGVYELQCETAGSDGNGVLGQLIPIDYIDGLETAVLTELLIPGEDTETDDGVRARYLQTFEAKAYGGNVNDYLQKTNSIEGVGSTKVTPVWDGGGTVKLTILNSEFNSASSVLIANVQKVMEGIAPIGHTVTVDTANGVNVAIAAVMNFDAGYTFDSLKTAIEDAIKSYLYDLRADWANQDHSAVLVSQISAHILAIDGIVDISNVRINGNAENLVLGKYEIPAFGGVING